MDAAFSLFVLPVAVLVAVVVGAVPSSPRRRRRIAYAYLLVGLGPILYASLRPSPPLGQHLTAVDLESEGRTTASFSVKKTGEYHLMLQFVDLPRAPDALRRFFDQDAAETFSKGPPAWPVVWSVRRRDEDGERRLVAGAEIAWEPEESQTMDRRADEPR